MKRNMTKILVLALTMATVFLAACASATPTAAPTSGTTPTAGPTEAPKPVTFTFAEHVANIDTQSPHVAAILKAFQLKYPNVTIEVQGTEVTEHITKMKLAAQSNTLPDLIWLEAPVAKDFIKANLLYDMTSELKARGMDAYFNPGMIDAATVDGKIYGLPSESLFCGFYYNKAILSKYGLSVPVTYDDLKNVVTTLHSKGVVTIAQGAKSSFSVWGFQAMLTRYGFFDKMTGLLDGSISWNNPDFIKCYDKVAELTKLGAFPENVANLDYFQAVEMFMGGQAAMVNAGSWETAKLEGSAIAKDVGFWWGPTFTDGVGEQKKGIKAPGGPYVISARGAADPDKLKAMMDFFQFFYGPEGTQIIVDAKIVPTTKYSGSIDASKTPVFAAMVAAANDDYAGTLEPFAQLPTSAGTAMFDSFYGIITGIYNPTQAADLVAAELKK